MGKYDLVLYLRGLKYDKDKVLANHGDGTARIDSGFNSYVDGQEFIVVERIKEKAEECTADISTISGNMNGIYPGAIVHADARLADGRPTIISGDDLPRRELAVGLDINGNTQPPEIVENPDEIKVNLAINKMLENWLQTGKKIAAKTTYKSVMAYSERQLEIRLGIKQADKLFGLDLKAIEEGKKKEMLVCFKQIYYSTYVPVETVSTIYTDAVTAEDLKRHYVDESNPAVAEVTRMDYGRMIVVKFSTNKTIDKAEAGWNASICGIGFKNNDKYKDVMENTSVSVFVYGGSTETASKLIMEPNNIEEVNKVIAADMAFTADSAASPISFTTNFIDDGAQAMVSKSGEYVKTNIHKRGKIHIATDSATLYGTKHQRLYGKRITSIKSNGEPILSGWERIIDAESGDKSIYVDGSYVEFGFSFDIVWGTDWPYTGPFWSLKDGPAKDIRIEWGGTVRCAWIKITVDGREVVHNTNCDSHDKDFFE